MKTSKFLLISLILLCGNSSYAGKPWRAGVNELIRQSSLVVVGTVSSLEPSSAIGERLMATIAIQEVISGHWIQSDVQVLIDKPNPNSFEWQYTIEKGPQKYLFFLEQIDEAAFTPVSYGSGIVNLDSVRIGDGPALLLETRNALKVKPLK